MTPDHEKALAEAYRRGWAAAIKAAEGAADKVFRRWAREYLKLLSEDIHAAIHALSPPAAAVTCATCGGKGLVLVNDVTDEHEPCPDCAPAAKPICATCNDTHRMALGDREAMCTRCPTPCGLCSGGAFCKTTPCDCSCHASATPSAAAGVDKPVPHALSCSSRFRGDGDCDCGAGRAR